MGQGIGPAVAPGPRVPALLHRRARRSIHLRVLDRPFVYRKARPPLDAREFHGGLLERAWRTSRSVVVSLAAPRVAAGATFISDDNGGGALTAGYSAAAGASFIVAVGFTANGNKDGVPSAAAFAAVSLIPMGFF